MLLKIVEKHGWKIAILTDSNSVADNVVQSDASQEYITARVHPMGEDLAL